MSKSDSDYWNLIHQTKKSDVSWWQDEDALWLDLLEKTSRTKHQGAIDVGAGSSYFADALAKLGYSPLYVNDLSHSALEEIDMRFTAKDSLLHLLPEDVRTLQIAEKVGLWHDRAVFHFFVDSDSQKEYKVSLLRNTQPYADFIIATFSPDGPDSCSGLQVQRWSAQDLAHFFAPEFSLMFESVRNHHTPWGGAQSFTVCVLRRNGEH